MLKVDIKTVRTAVSHSRIFKKIENEKELVYKYFPQNDKLQNQLSQLAKRYKQTPTIVIKQELLEKEREILYQELKNPELTLVRNYKKILPNGKFDLDKLFEWVQGLNATAIRRIEPMPEPFESKLTKRKIDIISKAYESMDDKTYEGKNAKLKLISTVNMLMEPKIVEDKKFFKKIIDRFTKSTSDRTLKKIIADLVLFTEPSYKGIISDLKQNPLQKNKLQAFLTSLNDEEVDNWGVKSARKFAKQLVKDLLTRKDVPPSIKRLAVWGAGKYKSNEAFDVISQIALNRSEKDIRLREFALHSVAFYVRKKPDEVRKILTTVEHDGSIFAPLAKILNEKISGIYHSKKNIEYERLGIGEKETKTLKKQIKGLFKIVDFKTNIFIDNEIDRNMLFFKDLFKFFKKRNIKAVATEDTVTRILKSKTGKRLIAPYPYSNRGDFEDAADGINYYFKNGKLAILGKNRLECKTSYNALTHELGHSLHDCISKRDYRKLEKLYNSAKKHNMFLESYAGTNAHEYFAEGCEAITAIYKPHDDLLDIDTNTRYKLLAKDKPLYNFIMQMIEKYSKKTN